jgi:hypothetical protein
MARSTKDTDEQFIEVGYEAKVVFTVKNHAKERLDLQATWQQSQGLWSNHPIFQGMSVREVIVWLRGEDCDV